MSMNFLLLLFALVHAALLAWTFRAGGAASPRLWLLRAMLFGMLYDNAVQFLGHWYIDAGWYEASNVVRFVLHSAVLPFLTLFGLSLMRSAGIAVASAFWFRTLCWAFTLAALAWGFYHEVLLLELGPKPAYGISKLGSLSGVPPIATILTNVALLPMAAALWRRADWPWLFLGALFIFLLNGATASMPWGFLAGNLGEVVFILSLLASHRRFSESSAKD